MLTFQFIDYYNRYLQLSPSKNLIFYKIVNNEKCKYFIRNIKAAISLCNDAFSSINSI